MGLLTALGQRFFGTRPTPRYLIAGLGNPGEDYRNTRHNAGFMVVDRIRRECGIPLDQKWFNCVFGTGIVAGMAVALVQPQAFMNRSGPPVLRLMSYYGISTRDLLIIHDDIDLALGRIKIKEKGGHGGHKGVKSLVDTLGNGDFPRLRIGIGRPERGGDVIRHVLVPFSAGEEEQLDGILGRAAEAAVTILCHGVEFGMNRFNRKS
ncbi:MAG: aminoacyl-tRNA hydrolase [Desulfosarcina sp.]|nr:aminoacyl-tRNA hydrolase [Desulfobacterales bacterium]